MAISSQTAKQLIPLSDEQLFELSGDALDPIMWALVKAPFEGLLLRAPKRVPLHDQQELPVVLASRQTVLRAWQITPARNLVLLSMDLDSGSVRVGRALRDPKEDRASFPVDAPRPPRPNDASAKGTAAGAWRLDARPLLDLPWEPAHLSLFALSLDWASNTQRVTLDAPLARFSAPPSGPLPPAAPGDVLPGYRQRAQSPALPPAGATFEIFRKDRDLLVAGAFSIAAREAHLAMPESEARAAGIAALVPATIALMGLDGGQPWLLPLVVPVYGPEPARPGESLQGWFSIDVTAQLGHPLPAGQYAAWVLFEGVPLGPRRFGI